MTSRVHFIFNRGHEGSGPSLTDTSMNGTWIDKMRVGKGNKAPHRGWRCSGQGDYGEGLPPLSNQQVPSGESSRGGDNLLGQTWL